MLAPATIQGRKIGDIEIAEIAGLMETNPGWGRWRLSKELAERWQWYAASGQLKDMAARTLLRKLDARGLIALPQPRCAPIRRRVDREPDWLDHVPPAPVVASLSALRPLQFQVVGPKDPDDRQFQRYLGQHHYLGYRGPVGHYVQLGIMRSCGAN